MLAELIDWVNIFSKGIVFFRLMTMNQAHPPTQVFKVLVHTFNCLHGTAPEYLSSLLKPCTSARSLRSAQQNRVQEHLYKTTYGSDAFINAAPHL